MLNQEEGPGAGGQTGAKQSSNRAFLVKAELPEPLPHEVSVDLPAQVPCDCGDIARAGVSGWSKAAVDLTSNPQKLVTP